MIKFKPTNRVTKDNLNSHDLEHDDQGTPQNDKPKKDKTDTSNNSTEIIVSEPTIIENILGNNNISTNNYIKSIINLTKSINVKNDNEAIYYNKYIEIKYPSHVINFSDKTTWRYYKQLNGEYHPLDTPIIITSLDNGASIVLTKQILNLHRKTKKELLKFSLFYKELIDTYPEQELFIKAIIDTSVFSSIQDIIKQEDFTIVSYDSNHIEDNETDLIYELQEVIYNYKVIRLIPHYSLADNLFLASQYHILYNFILTKIFAIRLQNAKTLKAHTFHIKNYLASHHFLDKYYPELTKKQSLFLYRNLLYLDNHSGRNDIFRILIDKLFTDRNISVVNYNYKQLNSLDDESHIKYKFNQGLLNNADLTYSANDFSLQNIKSKEYNLTEGNPKEWTYHENRIDKRFKNSLFNKLLTKDLETIIIDNTDTVKYKFIPLLIDYWAYLLKSGKMDFIVTIVDPISNKEIKLHTNDLFKLFMVVLFKSNNITLTEFPDYTIQRVFKESLPSNDSLLALCYNEYYWFGDLIDEIKSNVEGYIPITTSSQCEQFISNKYKLNIGLWALLSNLDDQHTNGQFELIIDRLHMTDSYVLNNESVQEFLTRITFNSVLDYDHFTLETLLQSVLNSVYDNKLDFLNEYKYIQKALVEVFEKFNSYTIQLISNYYSTSPIIAGTKDVRFNVFEDTNSKIFIYDHYLFNVDMTYDINLNEDIRFKDNSTHTYKYKGIVNVDLKSKVTIEGRFISKINVLLNNKILNGLDNPAWMINQSSEEQLEFLAMNL